MLTVKFLLIFIGVSTSDIMYPFNICVKKTKFEKAIYFPAIFQLSLRLVMRMTNRNIIRFVIILTIMLCMEGGKKFALINHQMCCDLYLADVNESEISNHHHLFDSLEEENWSAPSSFCYALQQVEIKNQIGSNSFAPQELYILIWQPPKLV